MWQPTCDACGKTELIGEDNVICHPCLLKSARAEENKQYWRFTRCANAPPVSPEVTRRICRLEKELREMKRQTPSINQEEQR